MTWRNSRATIQLRDEINAIFPTRSKRSDGTIGDAAHASRASDHNPWVPDPARIVDGVVTAIDITDDDATGADMAKVVRYLTQVSRDPRIKYLIHEGRIYSSYATNGYPAWAARPHSGPNGHFAHLHVSVNEQPYHFDSAAPWNIARAFDKPAPAPTRPTIPTVPKPGKNWSENLVDNLPVLRKGSTDRPNVRRLQGLLIAAGVVPLALQRGYVDGDFGPATEADVREVQRAKGKSVDGVVGQATWTALLD